MADFDLQEQLVASRMKRYGQQRQINAPQGRMVGRVYVAPNPLEYLAEGLRAYQAGQGEQEAEGQLKDLSAKRQTAIADALRNFGQKSQGAPAQPTGQTFQTGANEMGDEAAVVPQWSPEQKPDMMGAYQALLQAPDAQLRNSAMQGMIQMPQLQAQQEERQENRDFRKSEREAQAAQRMQEIQQTHALRMQQMQEQNASRAQMAEEQRAFQLEMKKLQQASGASAQPYYQPVQTGQGVMAFNARTGRVEAVMGPDGRPIVGAAADPSLQGQLAGAKAGATTAAKSQVEAAIEAPKVVAQAEEAIQLVDDLLKAPGFKQAVGGSRLLGLQKVPGTDAKDFDIRLDQLKGKQFLEAFQSLKGGGQITEVEGKKATDAIARMDAAGSEAEFTKAAREFQDVIRKGAERAKQKAGGVTNTPPKRLKFDAQGNVIP